MLKVNELCSTPHYMKSTKNYRLFRNIDLDNRNSQIDNITFCWNLVNANINLLPIPIFHSLYFLSCSPKMIISVRMTSMSVKRKTLYTEMMMFQILIMSARRRRKQTFIWGERDWKIYCAKVVLEISFPGQRKWGKMFISVLPSWDWGV